MGPPAKVVLLKVVQTDSGLGLLLNSEAEALLSATAGGAVRLDRLPGGDLRLSWCDLSLAAEAIEGEAFMDDYRETFDALAKDPDEPTR